MNVNLRLFLKILKERVWKEMKTFSEKCSEKGTLEFMENFSPNLWDISVRQFTADFTVDEAFIFQRATSLNTYCSKEFVLHNSSYGDF